MTAVGYLTVRHLKVFNVVCLWKQPWCLQWHCTTCQIELDNVSVNKTHSNTLKRSGVRWLHFVLCHPRLHFDFWHRVLARWGVRTQLIWGLIHFITPRNIKHALQHTLHYCHLWLSGSSRMHQIRCRPGSALDFAAEAYSAPQTPQLV